MNLEIAVEEDADLKFNEDLAELEDRSRRMLQREMQALGVLDTLSTDSEVALAEPNFVWEEASVTGSVDWGSILNAASDIPKA